MKPNLFKFTNLLSLITVLLVTVLCAPQLQAQQEKKVKPKKTVAKKFNVFKTDCKMKVDGVLNEEVWKKTEKIYIQYEFSPGDNIPAPVKTECMITFTKSKLYVAYRCFDPEPGAIRAHLMNRDIIDTFIQDDYVSILLDTYNDERRAFEYRVNPHGVQTDSIFNEETGAQDFSWDSIWASAGKITDFGYVVEMAIPFHQLRFPRMDAKQTWGISFSRSWPRNVRHRMRSHKMERNIESILSQLNKITGFEKISPGRNLEFVPTMVINRTDERTSLTEGELESGKIKAEPGISARWGITPSIMLNATINPDFSQVEADAAQLEVNTRFAIRYPEKRPFFLEGADIYRTPVEVVFTRRIYDPVWGTKLTGTVGSNEFGFIATQDRTNEMIIPSNAGSQSTSLDEDVLNGILRYRKNLGRGSSLGALYTGRTGDDYHNHVLGVDGFLRLNRRKSLRFQLLHSRTQYPDEVADYYDQKNDDFGGSMIYGRFRHTGRNIVYGLEYEDLSPNFRADHGFITRTDLRQITAFALYRKWGKKNDWYNRLSLRLNAKRGTDYAGTLTDQELWATVNYVGPLQTDMYVTLDNRKELYAGNLFNLIGAWGQVQMTPRKGLSYYFFGGYGDDLDYNNVRKSKTVSLASGVELSLGLHLNFTLTHTFERLRYEKEMVYTVNLSQLQLIYNFNTRAFIRATFQYRDLDRNEELYIRPVWANTKTLFTQLLFSYKLNPQTVLFLGYSDNNYGRPGVDLTRTDRTFFLKIGYAFLQ
ncbi:MAG: carbohydrate binding family 9 domain-containing protein [bacterium]|nr:carbohydrate binding family 9 domain-containing protein [bacterium]